MLAFLLAILSASLAIIWSLGFLLSALIGFRLQKVGGNKLRSFYPKIKWASIWTEEDLPDHWVMGKWFVGYIYTKETGQHGGETKTLYLFASTKWITGNVSESKSEEKEMAYDMLFRTGPYWRFHWEKISVGVPSVRPYKKQSVVIDQIMREFKKTQVATVLLYGPPKSGKSEVPRFLAAHLLSLGKQVTLVDTHKPTDPNDSFSALYAHINPTPDKPLIVVIEEVDGIIDMMHKGEIKRHEHLHIQITSKPDWNTWLDRFDRKIFKNVILIMTSNKPIEYFDALDPSYFRKGRINLKIKIN